MSRSTQIQISKPWNKTFVKKINKGFGDIDYVEHTQVTQKLIALIPDLDITTGDIIYDKIEDVNGVSRKFVTGLRVILTGTVDGKRIRREDYGMCDKPFFHSDPNKVYNNGQRAKECVSDAIKRCAMRFGIGLELYDTDAWLSDYLEKEIVELENLSNDEQQLQEQIDSIVMEEE